MKPHKDISVDTISKWLCTAIRESYVFLSPDIMPHVNAHDVIAIASSLSVQSEDVEDITSTGLWSIKFSFLNHYWDLSGFPGIVAANKLLTFL